MPDRFIAIATAEIGYQEGAGNDTKYGRWYRLNHNPWCAMFISWCADQAQILGQYVPRFAYVPAGVEWYQRHGWYRSATSDYLPQSGDIVFFSWRNDGQANHVGIVVQCDGATLVSIEGNTTQQGESGSGDGVYRKSRSLQSKVIMGYGAIPWPKEEQEMAVRDVTLLVDRVQQQVAAVLVNGENYVRLRDIVPLLGGSVDYDQEKKMPVVESKVSKAGNEA